jgi:hypothetical protein
LLGPAGFLTIFRRLSFSPLPLIRELGNRDDRFMDSLDNGGSGGSRVEVGGSAKQRQTRERASSPATVAYLHRAMRDIHTEEYSSQCIAVHLFHSPWPVRN